MMYLGILTLLLLSTVTTTALQQQQQDDSVVLDLANDLPYDVNNKLTTHVILYSKVCGQQQEISKLQQQNPPYGFLAREIGGAAYAQVFKDHETTKDTCQAVCVERGVDQSHAHAIMPHKYYYPGQSMEDFLEQTCRKVEVCILNYHDKEVPIQLYWINTAKNNEKVLHLEIPYGEKNTKCFSSFIGHQFEAYDGNSDKNTLLGTLKVEYTTVLAFGVADASDDVAKHAFDKEIESTLLHEWQRQARVKRTFSPLGFKKGRLPDDIFSSMTSFFVNNRGNAVLEEWGGRGVFVNWWETNCSFIQIPWDLKRKWQTRLLELVQAWAGVPIQQTDLYGMRRYESGARLLTHVDREATHAVSLIVNVAQGNLTEPWPVEVYDHMGRLHEVIMSPGDIVYYESAKCLHGRNRPLAGKDSFYVNLFTHYQPLTPDGAGDREWFKQPNHEGAPDPVLDVDGECRLETTPKIAEASPGQVGYIQSVQCDDPRLGNFMSPSLFTVTSGNDLIDWWRQTAPKDNDAAKGAGRDEL